MNIQPNMNFVNRMPTAGAAASGAIAATTLPVLFGLAAAALTKTIKAFEILPTEWLHNVTPTDVGLVVMAAAALYFGHRHFKHFHFYDRYAGSQNPKRNYHLAALAISGALALPGISTASAAVQSVLIDHIIADNDMGTRHPTMAAQSIGSTVQP